MEDIADKARRNLMGVAAGIVAVWALDIPLDGKLVGAVNLNEVQPWRAWFCALIVLGYFYCRFRLAPENKAGRIKYVEIKAKTEQDRNADYARAQFDALRTGSAVSLGFDLGQPPFQQLVPKEASMQEIIWGPQDKHGLPGTLTFYWQEPSGSSSGTWIGQAEFKIPGGWLRHQALLSHWRRVRNLNWEGLEVTLPTTLTLFAAGICMAKLLASLYYSWPFARQMINI
jgi:hypothetical protein